MFWCDLSCSSFSFCVVLLLVCVFTLWVHCFDVVLLVCVFALWVHCFDVLLLLCVFTFWVPCCDVRYELCIKTMFGSSLPSVVWMRVYICLFGVQHVLTISVTWRVSYKRQEMVTLCEHLDFNEIMDTM